MSEKFEGEVSARLRGIDKRLEKMDTDIGNLKSRDVEIARFNEIFNTLTNQHEDFKDEFKQNRVTLGKINDNLSFLNSKFGALDNRVQSLEIDIKESEHVNYSNVNKRLDTVEENVNKSNSKGMIDLVVLSKNIVTLAIPAVILAALLVWLGLR